MATRYYGIAKDEQSVTIDTSTTSKSMELAVDDAAGLKKKDVWLALQRIQEALIQDDGFNDI